MNNIEELYTEFSRCAEGAKLHLQTMLTQISEGRAPDTESVKTLNESISDLKQKYKDVREAALSELSSDDLPEAGSSAISYVEAVRNSMALRLKRMLDGAEKCLEKFISVRSLVDAYAKALAPFQDDASEMLAKIRNGADLRLEDVEEYVTAPKTFMDAVECEDKNSDAGLELCDKVDKFYPPRVGKGVVAGQYFIDAADKDSGEAQNGQAAAESTASENKIAESSVADKSPSEKSTEFKVRDEKTEKRSKFVTALYDRAFFDMSEKDFGEIKVDIGPDEDKRITASIFANLLKSGPLPLEKEIIQKLDLRGIVSKEFLKFRTELPDKAIDGCLDYLLKKGLVRKYSVTPGGEFFTVSPRLVKALMSKEASKLVGVRQYDSDKDFTFDNEKASDVVLRVSMSKVGVDALTRVKNRKLASTMECVCVYSGAFYNRLSSTNNHAECEITLGAFWTDDSECDLFLKRIIMEETEPSNDTSSLVVAAIDVRHAQILADVLKEIPELSNLPASVYLYSFTDNAYYTYPGLEPTDPDGKADKKAEFPPKLDDSCDNTDEVEVTTQSVDGSEGEAELNVHTDEVIDDKENGSTGKLIADSEQADQNPSNSGTSESSDSAHAAPCIVSYVNTSIPYDIIETNVLRMLSNRQFYAALAYLRSMPWNDKAAHMYEKLAYAMNDPMMHCNYLSENIYSLIDGEGEFEQDLIIATALRMSFSNQVRYDYSIKSFYSSVKNFRILEKYPSIGNVLYMMVDFKDTYKKGVDAYAAYRTKSRTEIEKELAFVTNEASNFYENLILAHKTESCNQKRFINTKNAMFSPNSDFGQYLKVVTDGDKSFEPMVVDFLRENFFTQDADLDADSYDDGLVWDYIVNFWDDAGKRMHVCRNNDDLKGRLRSNIMGETTKIIRTLTRWCVLVEKLNDQSSDDKGALAFRKICKDLKESIDLSMTCVIGEMDSFAKDSRDAAGLAVIYSALEDISECLDGSYMDGSRRFYYAPFLLTSDVMLDRDFLPDLERHSITLESLQPYQRILDHAGSLASEKREYLARLDEIIDKNGDDYGSAELIIEYLSWHYPNMDLSEWKDKIETGKQYAEEASKISISNFTADLELAQSYGQIDTSVEDRKEMILQIINECRELADKTANYGFLKRVMNDYLSDIRESARARGEELMAQLENLRACIIHGLSIEERDKRAAKIREMIRIQNYTVAEDLLARFTSGDEDNEELIDKDFLKEFIGNYSDYYIPVSRAGVSFSSLVSSRTRNKEERGARRLAECWLPGGSALGKDKLTALLNCLGFRVDTVQQQTSIGKYENYFVKTLSSENGKRINYTHPIAAFGSGASRDGFRVVCVNGQYAADGLIDIMNEIGDARHTMIFLDSTLTLSERRRLARKTKNLGDKLFVVVDRVVMMFLVRNYDENKMNRMLMSLVVPFGYYQPYIWDSANVMPPELFMGRKKELEDIKSVGGVNIVYGGRQLGKSALLKKAKEDIDHDENGDRAVYIEIKDKNYREAARKIGHELYDQHILEEDIDTDDWDELVRAMRQRLESETAPRIPYLLLLLDEADMFIESCEAVNYHPFDALKEVQNISSCRFKFVIAGLRNVVRFKREAALGNNSVLTHIKSMTVTPFNTSEARELLEIPLHYLGFRFPKGKESLITLILATTNYFPGLIQLYCAKLLEAMRGKEYAGYKEADTPIYEVSENHIKKVLSDPMFIKQIREKFEITLKLGGDNYYYLIALLMASLYHQKGYSSGHSAADIKAAGEALDIKRIAELDESKIAAFMEELRELNVLRNTDETHYLFTRVSFFQMMGNSAEVDDKLADYMEV